MQPELYFLVNVCGCTKTAIIDNINEIIYEGLSEKLGPSINLIENYFVVINEWIHEEVILNENMGIENGTWKCWMSTRPIPWYVDITIITMEDK